MTVGITIRPYKMTIRPPVMITTMNPDFSLGLKYWGHRTGYKSAVTTRINKKQNNPGQKVWQRNYHDHIIRSESSLERIRHYISNNPAQWENHRNNPGNIS